MDASLAPGPSGYRIYQHDLWSDQPARAAAGPFASWREAFLACCDLAQAAGRAAAHPDRYSVRLEA